LRADSRFAGNTLRQNLKSVDCFIPPASARAGLCAIARHAFFAVAIVAALALTLPFASVDPASAQEQAPAVLSLEFNQADGILEIEWSGLIVAGVADELRTSVAKYGTALKRVVLFLDSAGGQVDEGDRVIAVLNEIKQGHRLATVVPHGKLCASMCIPIFLQGDDRFAARASLWIFHEASQPQANGGQRTDMTETWRLFRKYYGSAGVSMHWLKSIAPMIKGADLWQTGGDLIDAKTGIIMHALGDTIERTTAPAAVETNQASSREAAAKEPRGRSRKVRTRRL
jgi:ATP-dependent protease ClpP protease subunit